MFLLCTVAIQNPVNQPLNCNFCITGDAESVRSHKNNQQKATCTRNGLNSGWKGKAILVTCVYFKLFFQFKSNTAVL